NRVNLQLKSDRQILVEINVDLPIFVVHVARLRTLFTDDKIVLACLPSVKITPGDGAAIDGLREPSADGFTDDLSRRCSRNVEWLNRRARRRSKRSSKPSFPSMERGLAGVTMISYDPDSIEESR
ncbi:hypothetical protein ALC60_08140, partial [Trachymyrmex zeteki]